VSRAASKTRESVENMEDRVVAVGDFSTTCVGAAHGVGIEVRWNGGVTERAGGKRWVG
jgi:hypothetical protein